MRKRLHTLPSHPALGEPRGSDGGRPTKKHSQGLKEPWGRSSVSNDGDSTVCQDKLTAARYSPSLYHL